MPGSFSPSGEPLVRPLQDSDLSALQRIYAQAVAEGGSTADLVPPGPDRWTAFLQLHRDPRWPAWVLEHDGRVRAYAFLSPWRPGREGLAGTVEVSYYVDRAHRRQGMAWTLLQHATREASALGHHHLLAILLAENRASVALLRQAGFVEWGRLPGVFRRSGENAFAAEARDQLLMGRAL